MYGVSPRSTSRRSRRTSGSSSNGRPDNPTSIEWTFEPRGEDRTFVTVKNWGFGGDAEKVVAEAVDSTGGFTFLLAGLKAFLEHGIELNLIADHQPSALVEGWESRPEA